MKSLDILTAPASERHSFMMKVIDRANKMQAATVRKADRIEKKRKVKKTGVKHKTR